MIIMICGSRIGVDRKTILEKLDQIIGSKKELTICHGGAAGADTLASEYARSKNIKEIIIQPDYHTYHYKLAPLKRNTDLVNMADMIICIWGIHRVHKGGTMDAFKKARNKNIKIIEILPDGSHRVTNPTLSLF